MRVCSSQNGHLITPIVRCERDVPQRDPYTAAPGTVPYHRFLEANRKIEDLVDLSQACNAQNDATPATPLLPKLGEIIDPQPRPMVVAHEIQLHQQMVPATGRVLDTYA